MHILSSAQCLQAAGGRRVTKSTVIVYPADRPASFGVSGTMYSEFYGLQFFADRVQTFDGTIVHEGHSGSFSYQGTCFSVSQGFNAMTRYSAAAC